MGSGGDTEAIEGVGAMMPLHCHDSACDTLLGRIYPVRDNDYKITSYQFVPYALPENTRNMDTKRAIGSPVQCHVCGKETLMLYSEEG